MPRRAHLRPGLQTERTLLSWERSAFGFLVGGALVLLRPHGPLQAGRLLLALAAVLLALMVMGLGFRRSQTMKATSVVAGRIVIPTPRKEVLLLGGATVGFSMAIVTVLLYSA